MFTRDHCNLLLHLTPLSFDRHFYFSTKHQIMYADDPQLCFLLDIDGPHNAFVKSQSSVSAVRNWMTLNKSKLNAKKLNEERAAIRETHQNFLASRLLKSSSWYFRDTWGLHRRMLVFLSDVIPVPRSSSFPLTALLYISKGHPSFPCPYSIHFMAFLRIVHGP